MTVVKKEQRQDDYFNQQSILLTLPANISLLTIGSTYVGWQNVRSMLCQLK